MNPSQLIAALNAMTLGDLDSIRSKLDEVRSACRELGHEELADRLEEARGALVDGDVKTFRKRVDTVVSRLGHLR